MLIFPFKGWLLFKRVAGIASSVLPNFPLFDSLITILSLFAILNLASCPPKAFDVDSISGVIY